MPSTAEFWDVDGVPLQTDEMNLRSWGGSREEPPPMRGSDQQVPFDYGEQYVPKTPDSREIVFDGWMVDRDSARLRKRWRAFRSLLWRPEEQFLLTRRWVDEFGGLMEATGRAAYVNGLSPEIVAGGTRLTFKVTVRMVDPFFYSDWEQINFPAPGPKTVDILGDWASKRVQVELFGAQQGSSLTVMRGATVDNLLRYGSLTAERALVNVETFRATEYLAGAETRTSAKVGHSGRQRWLHLPPSATRIDYARSSAGGTAAVRYQPAWI